MSHSTAGHHDVIIVHPGIRVLIFIGGIRLSAGPEMPYVQMT